MLVAVAIAAFLGAQPPTPSVFGTFDRQIDELDRPTIVAAGPNGLWAVLEADAARVRVYAGDGSERHRIEAAGTDGGAWNLAVGLDGLAPTALAFRDDGRLTIVTPERIATFDVAGDATGAAAGVPWRVISGLDLGWPSAVAWRSTDPASDRDDQLWIADRTGSVIVVDADGAVRSRFRGAPTKPFLEPSGVAIAQDGSVFVADANADAIIRLSEGGEELGRFGERGAFPGLFNAPRGLAIAGGFLYVTDELNHRVTIHALSGAFQSFWGMHAVVPREGQGKIHYPSSLAIAPDGSAAYVAEPFERRVQRFTRSDPNAAAAATMPSREGVMSHFGGEIACDGELLLLEEPESSSVFLFDLRDATPLHVTTFGGSGVGPDKFGRVGALFVDKSTQMAIVADHGARRLAQFQLHRDRSKPVKMDPFMATLVRSWDLVAWSERVRGLGAATASATFEPSGFAMQGGRLWTIDRTAGALVALDTTLAPTKVVATGVIGAKGLAALDDGGFVTTAPERGQVVVLRGDGSVRQTLSSTRSDPPYSFGRPNAVCRTPDGRLLVTDAARDDVVVLEESNGEWRVSKRIGARGTSDGQWWMPQGVAIYTGAPILDDDGAAKGGEAARFVAVDRGNHRAQIFTVDGDWLMTFGLGRSYTRPRLQGES